MLCCTFTNSYMPVTFEVSYHVPVGTINTTRYIYTRFVHYVVVSQTMHPQLRSAWLYIIVQQRSGAQPSAAQRGAVPCPSFCGAVSCGAVRYFEHKAVVPGMIRVPGTVVYVLCTRLFCFLLLIVLSRSPRFRPPANITRTAVQNVISKSTQHSAGQLALHKHLTLALSIRYSHQIVTGLFFLSPLHVSVAFYLARA